MALQTLPTQGGDINTWGDKLNSWLLVSHNANGAWNSWTTGTRPTVASDKTTGINTSLNVIEQYNESTQTWSTIFTGGAGGSGSLTVVDTSTADLTLTSGTLSVAVPLRINGNAVSTPSGSTPTGYNFTSTGNTVTITNPSAGVINLEAVASGGGGGTTAKYLAVDAASNGAYTATVNTNSSVTAFTGTLTANRVVTLSTTGAVAGDRIELSFLNANFSTFNYTVVANSTTLSTISSQTRTIYVYTGTSWIQFA